MQAKSIKPKKCKNCKADFKPFKSTQSVCSPNCATQLAKVKVAKQMDAATKDLIRDMKVKVKTHSDWKREFQAVCNSIVRALDKGGVCISSLKPLNPKFDAGHRFARGGFSNLSFNLLNIYAQSVHDNQHKSGNPDGFDHGLKTIYGPWLYEEVHGLKEKYHGLVIDTMAIKTALPIAKSILKVLITENKVYDPAERILKRKQFNKMIGIYTQ